MVKYLRNESTNDNAMETSEDQQDNIGEIFVNIMDFFNSKL